MLSLQLKRSINFKMLTLMDKLGIACMAIVGFQLSKFVLKVLYRTVVAPQIGRINVNKLKDMGEYACKYKLNKNFTGVFLNSRFDCDAGS